MKRLTLLLVLILAFALPGISASTTETTLSANVLTSSVNQIAVTSATGFVAGSTFAFVGTEVMDVIGVSGTTITVARGMSGTSAQPHNSGELVYVGPSSVYVSWPIDPVGRCTAANYAYLPMINVRTGSLINCSSSRWTAAQSVATLVTPIDSQPVLINSRDYLMSNNNIGFQVKPNQAATNANFITGGEISPRCANGIACQGIIGLHVDATLKGTTARTISSDVRTLNLEMVGDNGGTSTVSGNVSVIRIRSVFSATTITGKFVPIRIEYPEAQTNSKTYDAVLELTGTVAGVWDDTDADSGDTEAGYIKVLVNGNARYIVLYSDAP